MEVPRTQSENLCQDAPTCAVIDEGSMFLVETAGMMADMFTKVADKVVFTRCRAYVMNLM